MLNRVYCTYFDHNYLPRGLALHQSLQQHAPGARLWVLCLSEACYRTLTALDLPNLGAAAAGGFRSRRSASGRDAADAQRDRILFHLLARPGCCTCWKTSRDAEWVTYLDSDLFFFASPDPIYDEMKDAAFGIVPHRFTRRLADQRRFGLYNVGWVSVRRCDEGFAALRWWRERCIEWCYDRVEGDRFADQRYLDRLPELFKNVHVIGHLGANLAPWNLEDLRVEWRDGSVRIEDRYPLLFFHFYGVKRARALLLQQPSASITRRSRRVMRHRIYEPYTSVLCKSEDLVAPYLKGERSATIRRPSVGAPQDRVVNVLRSMRGMLNRGLDMITGRTITVPP